MTALRGMVFELLFSLSVYVLGSFRGERTAPKKQEMATVLSPTVAITTYIMSIAVMCVLNVTGLRWTRMDYLSI